MRILPANGDIPIAVPLSKLHPVGFFLQENQIIFSPRFLYSAVIIHREPSVVKR
jgi:hypothetical protein